MRGIIIYTSIIISVKFYEDYFQIIFRKSGKGEVEHLKKTGPTAARMPLTKVKEY
jgi:hypothetical protein